MNLKMRGFTLIEVLVVVILVAIIMATIVSGFSGADREQEFKGIVTRIAMRIEMARQRAIQSNTEWGIFIDRESLTFATYDRINEQWVERGERAYQQESTDLELRFDVEVEDYSDDLVPTDEEDDEIPALWLFSSGEVMPFTLEVEPVAVEMQPWTISSDGLSRATLQRAD